MQASAQQVIDGDDSVALITASRRYQVATSDLQLGMFIAELDRPWLDTPFLLQGFLADSQVEIDTLRKCCTYVYVDLEQSNPEVVDSIRRTESQQSEGAVPPQSRSSGNSTVREVILEAADPPTQPIPEHPEHPETPSRAPRGNRVYKTRADVRISSDTRERFRQFVRATSSPMRLGDVDDGGALGRALAWLKRCFAGDPRPMTGFVERDRASRDAILARLPAQVSLTEYADARPMEQELPRARGTFVRCEDVLKTLAADIRVGRIPQVAEVASAVDDMVASMIDNPDALMWVARMRDEDISTYNHGVKVALYLISLGRQLGFPKRELSYLGLIGMLADVGKIKLPRALLDKPGMLAPSEYRLIKEHVRLGLDAMREAGTLPPEVELGIAQHHERLDGSGYPKGLKGNDISIYGRMAAIADSFAALITPRAYANPSAPQDALMNLYEWAGTSFHEPLVEQFVQAVGVFPVGSLVELSSGEVSIVVAHNRVRRLEPRVLVLTWPDKSPLAEPIERDLLTQGKTAQGRLRIVRGLPAGAYGLKLRDYYMADVARANGLPA
ncbi:MAG: HD-GYP domain-containing protein [Burkholderiales bacterium]|nr:HD-GYP domain-containing protein [Burkholderiales bacterium]MCZ8102950.1 HD-GYP domain-containing protein [Burkholderiales bacterium]